MKDESGQTGFFVVVSVIASLLIHVAIWQVAAHVQVIRAEAPPAYERQERTIISVAPDDLRKVPMPPVRERQEVPEPIREETMEQINRVLAEYNLTREVPPEPKAVLSGLGRDLIAEKVVIPESKSKEPIGTAPLSSPSPTIMQIVPPIRPEDDLLTNRRMTPNIPREQLQGLLVPSVTSANPGAGRGRPEPVDVGMRLGGLPTRPARELPQLPPVTGREPTPVPPPDNDIVKPPDRVSEPTNQLDSQLDIGLSVYWDQDDGSGYFEIVIRPNSQADRLAKIPMDILFLVDASASIGRAKMIEFRDGLRQALDYLQPEDRFNIVTFRDQPRPLFDTFVQASPERREQAKTFVGNLSSSGRTDVYAALAPYVTLRRGNTSRPYLIFMLSDGRTTTGHELANNEFIKRVTNENESNASIFSLSAGKEANQFLMDFLSYRNRGRSLHVPELAGTAAAVTQYIGSLSDIIVANPECQITGNLEGEVFPRRLQHLFRGNDLRVYGRVPAGTRQIGVQVRGRNREGKQEELIVTADLSQVTVADEALAREWAAQKVYHLVAQWTVSNDDATRDAVQALAAKYRILMPYLDEAATKRDR